MLEHCQIWFSWQVGVVVDSRSYVAAARLRNLGRHVDITGYQEDSMSNGKFIGSRSGKGRPPHKVVGGFVLACHYGWADVSIGHMSP